MKQLIVHSELTKQTIVDYIKAATDVCTYAVSINTTTLPNLVIPPSQYGDFVDRFTVARLHVMRWMSEIVPTFDMIPTSFINFNSLVQPQLTLIKTNLELLQRTPTDAPAKQAVITAVNTLIQQTATSRQLITDLNSWITNYQGSIVPDAKALDQLCKTIALSAGADEEEIKKLHAVFDKLQAVIDDRNELARLNLASNVILTIFLAVVGAVVGAPFSPLVGAIIGGVVGITTGVITTFVPIHSAPDYQETMQDIQTEMDSVTKEIGLINTVVGSLQSLSKQFNTLVEKSGNASAQAQVVHDFWHKQQTNLSKLVSDLNDILSDIQLGSIEDALSDIKDAQASWTDLINFVESIKGVTYTITPTYLPPAK